MLGEVAPPRGSKVFQYIISYLQSFSFYGLTEMFLHNIMIIIIIQTISLQL